MKNVMVRIDKLQYQRKGFVYYLLSTFLLAFTFFSYIIGSSILPTMDSMGWLFFTLSCVSHAAIIMLLPLGIYALLAKLRQTRLAAICFITIVSVFLMLTFLNLQVYHLYRFHINGIILNMVFGSGAGEIFNFDMVVILKEVGMLLLFVAAAIILWTTIPRLLSRCSLRFLWSSVVFLLIATLAANATHVYGAFFQKTSIMKSKALLPYYFPLTAKRALEGMGYEAPVSPMTDFGSSTDVVYPLHPLKSTASKHRPNIIFLFIDSWNKRTLTPECMPNVYHEALQSQWYDNHFSSSNGTRFSIFGLFFSVPSCYWNSFESSHISPLFIDELLRQGYDLRIHASATLVNPPFSRVVFQRVPHLQVSTPGNTTIARDERITHDFISELPKLKKQGRPFFSFLFYDLAHNFEYPKEAPKKFTPSWDFADYTKLDNNIDPTEFFNLYRNCCWQIDRMIGQIIQKLKQEGLYDNSIIVITGDHAQEFNENHKNYWGHGGNFSKWQIGIPLLYHVPGQKPAKFTHRTTHYDIVPTLMHDQMGIVNPLGDYSFGKLLSDRSSRRWHVVGSDMDYAFIVGGDTIIAKKVDGSMDVTDSRLNPVNNYHVNPREFNDAIVRANRFFRK